MRAIATVVYVFFISLACIAQQVNIIPQPASIKMGQGNFILSNKIRIEYMSDEHKPMAQYLQARIKEFSGISCLLQKSDRNRIYDKSSKKNIILLNDPELVDAADWQEDNKYFLDVNAEFIQIEAVTDTAFFYGIQTLLQLLPIENPKSKSKSSQLAIPQLRITDYPRFAYRGMHLDVSRRFRPVDFVKKYIDYLALHKMNYFHWHLTDDQGWRIEIKKYPKLTSVGGWRNGTIIGRYPGTGNDGIRYGGFYTQAQIKEVVKYAADRYITVIPEIEMPGHSSAAIAAYPELSCFPGEPTIKYFPKQCKWSGDTTGKKVQQTWGVFDDVYCAGKENTFQFTQDVLDEVLALFPSSYIHVGGDECPKANWKRCPACQQRMRDNNLKDEHHLQSYFIQRVEKYLNSKGRKLIGWDEILEGGLAPNATVMSWQGEKGGIEAAKQNHNVVMSPQNPVYFDHTQSQNEDSVTIGGYNPLEKVYAYEPVPKGLTAEEEKYILGAQANMWAEYMKNTKKVEYMLFPRLSALSEVLWSPKEKRNWDDFQKRLLVQFKRYDLWKTNYSKAYFDLLGTVRPTEDYTGVYWILSSNSPVGKIAHSSNAPETRSVYYTNPIKIKSSITTKASLRDGQNLLSSISQEFSFNKATGKKITLIKEASEKYPADGAFTLVNGVINEKGFARSREFLGFNGTDCEAVIDLGESQLVSFVVVNALNRTSSWIWRPLTAEVFGSADGEKWYSLKLTDDFEESKDGTGKGKMILAFKATYARFVKVVITNWGEIPAGNPGAGNKPWLFVDEIEVDGPTEAELRGKN